MSSDEQPRRFFIKRGQPSLEDLTGEPSKDFRFKLPESLYDFMMQQSSVYEISAAEYLRRLIAGEKAREQSDKTD